MCLEVMGGRLDEMKDEQTLRHHYSRPFRSHQAPEAHLDYCNIPEERLVPIYSSMVALTTFEAAGLSTVTPVVICGAICVRCVLGDFGHFLPHYREGVAGHRGVADGKNGPAMIKYYPSGRQRSQILL
jgi:hypothetical protein